MRFGPETSMFCGNSCATSYDTGASWGLGLRFTKPFIDDREGFKLDEVETSQGTIYLKMLINPTTKSYYGTDHSGKDIQAYPYTKARGPDGIEHYNCNEVINFGNYCHAKVGMCLAVDYGVTYIPLIEVFKRNLVENKYAYLEQRENDVRNLRYYEGFVTQYKNQLEKIEKTLEGILLYKSVPFHNLVHAERKEPSCTLYIYDKEMKNAIPSGV